MERVDLNPANLLQIAEIHPRALATYIICHQFSENGVFDAETSFIKEGLSLSWTRFKNDIKSLARLGMLEWKSHAFGLTVILPEGDFDENHLDFDFLNE